VPLQKIPTGLQAFPQGTSHWHTFSVYPMSNWNKPQAAASITQAAFERGLSMVSIYKCVKELVAC